MVAVVIVGLLAALATPEFTERMRDRRTNQAAHEVALHIEEELIKQTGWRPTG